MESSWDYPEELMNGLNKLREQDQLCDIIICVGGKAFPAHKAVLAATGDYFLTMFTSGFKESSESKITMDGSAEAWKIFLEFAYTGHVILQISTCIFEALEIACYTQFTRFAEACSSALQKVLMNDKYEVSVSDVCNVMLLAEKHSYLKKLHEVSLQYLEDHVEGLKSLGVFLEYTSITLLQAFLSQENLASENEEKQVLELVINWLKHDWEKRKKHSHQLLQKVRLGLVDSEDIKELVGQEILDIPECLELVNHVLQVQASKKPRDVLSIENPEIAATRSTITAPILSCGGKFQFYDANHKKHNFDDDDWSDDDDDENHWVALDNFAPLPSKTSKYSVVVVDSILYALGGTEFYSYQSGANKWLQLPPMSERQNVTKLVSLGGCIYAVGTYQGSTYHLPKHPGIVIECYDIGKNKWEVVEPPAVNDTGSVVDGDLEASSVLVFEGKILVSSVKRMDRDYVSHDFVFLEILTVYDPEMDKWQIIEIGRRQHKDIMYGEVDSDEEEDTGVMETNLFIYKEELYRILNYYYTEDDDDNDISVNRIILQSQDDGTIRVKVGHKLSKANLESDSIHAFCIGDKEFDVIEGVICEESQGGYNEIPNKDLEPGNMFSLPTFHYAKNVTSTPVWFTFDRKKLSSSEYNSKERESQGLSESSKSLDSSSSASFSD